MKIDSENSRNWCATTTQTKRNQMSQQLTHLTFFQFTMSHPRKDQVYLVLGCPPIQHMVFPRHLRQLGCMVVPTCDRPSNPFHRGQPLSIHCNAPDIGAGLLIRPTTVVLFFRGGSILVLASVTLPVFALLLAYCSSNTSFAKRNHL